jgi:hypothetical protein
VDDVQARDTDEPDPPRLGDRVVVQVEHGAYADQILADDEDSHVIPDAMSFTDAAAMGLVYQTAHFALIDRGVPRHGYEITDPDGEPIGDAAREADPEDLFGMSTAYLTMGAELDFESAGTAALCFSDVDSTDFADAVQEVEDILAAGEEETGTSFRRHGDQHGYQWVILDDDDPEDLVTSIHFAADTFIEREYGSRLLAAVFGFDRPEGDGHVYWVYSFRRGAYYPFAPDGDHDRDEAVEFKLESVLDGELEVEGDKEYWYPLWPDRPGGHPWE